MTFHTQTQFESGHSASLYAAHANAELMKQHSAWAVRHARLNKPSHPLLEAPKAKLEPPVELPKSHRWRWPIPRDIEETTNIMLEYWADIPPKAIVNVARIKAIVAAEFGVTVLDLESHRRTNSVVIPRQIIMYLAKAMTRCSLPEIGRRLGGKDHTTVLHGVRKIERLCATDAELARLIDRLKANIERGCA